MSEPNTEVEKQSLSPAETVRRMTAEEVQIATPKAQDLPKSLFYTPKTEELNILFKQLNGKGANDPESQKLLGTIKYYYSKAICFEEFEAVDQAETGNWKPVLMGIKTARLETIKDESAEILEAEPMLVNHGISRPNIEILLTGPASHNYCLTHFGSYHYTTSSAYGGSDICVSKFDPQESRGREPLIPQEIMAFEKSRNQMYFVPGKEYERENQGPDKGLFTEPRSVYVSQRDIYYFYMGIINLNVIKSEQAMLCSGDYSLGNCFPDSPVMVNKNTVLDGDNTRIPVALEPTVLFAENEEAVNFLRQEYKKLIDPEDYFLDIDQKLERKVTEEAQKLERMAAKNNFCLQVSKLELPTSIREKVDLLLGKYSTFMAFYQISIAGNNWKDLIPAEVPDQNDLWGASDKNATDSLPVEDLINIVFQEPQQTKDRLIKAYYEIFKFPAQDPIYYSPEYFREHETRRLEQSLSISLEEETQASNKIAQICLLSRQYAVSQFLRNFYSQAESSPFQEWQAAIGSEGERLEEWIKTHVVVHDAALGNVQQDSQTLLWHLPKEDIARIKDLLKAQNEQNYRKPGLVISSETMRYFVPIKNTA